MNGMGGKLCTVVSGGQMIIMVKVYSKKGKDEKKGQWQHKLILEGRLRWQEMMKRQ